MTEKDLSRKPGLKFVAQSYETVGYLKCHNKAIVLEEALLVIKSRGCSENCLGSCDACVAENALNKWQKEK